MKLHLCFVVVITRVTMSKYIFVSGLLNLPDNFERQQWSNSTWSRGKEHGYAKSTSVRYEVFRSVVEQRCLWYSQCKSYVWNRFKRQKQIGNERGKAFRKSPQCRQRGCLKSYIEIANGKWVQGRLSYILAFSLLLYKGRNCSTFSTKEKNNYSFSCSPL